MIGYLKGDILHLTSEYALIEVGGIGYEVQLTGTAYSSIVGKTVGEVFTYMHVKEDAIGLFGFSSLSEKEMFLKLISVSGIGPKMGIAVLSSMDANSVAVAIATGNVSTLSKVKGLGKKTAERIVLELRDKVGALPQTTETSLPSVAPMPIVDADDDAIVALANLGFKRDECLKAVQKAKAQGAVTTEEIFMAALRSM